MVYVLQIHQYSDGTLSRQKTLVASSLNTGARVVTYQMRVQPGHQTRSGAVYSHALYVEITLKSCVHAKKKKFCYVHAELH